ncbi:HK97 family phage major capsid protein [Rhodobium orientis]|uniref:Phage major capsid protein n=1 Tax=Rhodobium orientis TaxID=34017 RepID=A0A327JRS4_9HYPH|nr:phage major capsid protein [Rhodobium orientis]MBB4303770.1 HK97 family phage major capsid protein [Rhodobium orientis]MBK5947890.1 phage major capsid protein [Rhodobium orientis]RAI26058.1 phage major capsid protein [Rhodobium orientis]
MPTPTVPATARPSAPTSALEMAEAFEDFMTAFEAFKETNDRRLADLERQRGSDPLTEEKLDRLNRSLDDQKRLIDGYLIKSQRPRLGFERGRTSVAGLEHKAAFDAYVRSGRDDGLHRLEEKALSVGSDPDGGYLVPDETETEIMRRLAEVSPIRAIADVRQVSSSVYKKPFSISGPAVGWVGETTDRTPTAAPTLDELSFPTMELYAMPAATATLLDDTAVNIDEWLAAEVETAFAEQEGSAFVAGDGNAKPRGFLDYDTIAESSWAWKKLGYVATGIDGAFPADTPSDILIDLVYTLKAGYRQNARWVMNRSTQGELRKLKDADDNYIWQPPATADAQAMLMNFPVVEAEDMPDIDSDTMAIAFGDFRRGYLIVDRLGVRVLRDPYSAKPYVLFYTTKRVGGGVQDFDAIKLLKFGES